ncbi:MAG: hypothetical protein ACLGH0_03370, partial [Thermoanaerobaculia bacterium]
LLIPNAQRRAEFEQSEVYRALLLWNDKVISGNLRERLATFVASHRPQPASISGYVALLDQSLTELVAAGIPQSELDPVREALAAIDPRIFRYADLALVTYRSAQALKGGANPIHVITTAAAQTPCDRMQPNDLQCGFRFTGVVLSSIVFANEQLPSPDELDDAAARKRFLDLVAGDLRKRLADPENIGVEAWATRVLLAYFPTYADFADRVLNPVVELHEAIMRLRQAKAEADAAIIDARSQDVVRNAFSVARLAFATLPIDGARRDRAVNVLTAIENGWVGTQQKDYARVFGAARQLSTELNLDSRFIDALNTYGDWFDAFTIADTEEEFRASLERAVNASPTAVDVQQRNTGITLGLLVGATAGLVDQEKDAIGFAPYVPVGIDLSRRQNGIMVSLLDIGTLTSLYIQNGETSAPDAKLKNVFSPGVVYRRAWKNRPFVWGLGASAVPEIDTDGERVMRYAVFVAYHRPLLPVYPIPFNR